MSNWLSQLSSSRYVKECPDCIKWPLSSNRILHITEDEATVAFLAGDQIGKMDRGFTNLTLYTLPLDGDSRWIHVIKETKNEDLGSTKRHSDPVRGQAGA